MSGTWNLLKRVGVKKFDQMKDSFQSTKERIDKDLPLGLRFNGIVEIPSVDFILGGDDLKVKHPGGDTTVASYGTIPVGHSMVHRFYLDSQSGVYVLQIVTNLKKEVEECRLFMPLDELYPDDWDFWLSDRDGYIGMSIFQTKDNVQYFRVWQNQDAETTIEQDQSGNKITRIPPVQLLENIYLDQFGENSETVKYDSMLYGRHANDSMNEFLLLSAVDEQDGASVQIMVGVDLEPMSLKII